jgi:signal transduction histidine kinase
MFMIILYQRAKVVIARRNEYILSRNSAKERAATADILTLSRDVITKGIDNDKFLTHFVEYVLRALKGTGGAVLQCDERGYFYGSAVAGTFPPLKDVTPSIEQQLMAHAKKHTEFFRGYKLKFRDSDIDELCGEKGFAFFDETCPIWFPERFVREAPRILIAPIKVNTVTLGAVIITSKNDFDSHALTEADGQYLVRLAELASLSLEVLSVFKEKQEYQERLQSAREEGMMQVSTGIIHNIGNAVTVAKLSVLELQEKMGIKEEERPETLILNELMPTMKQKLAENALENFLLNDPAGTQYFDIFEELLKHLNEKTTTAAKQLNSLSDKLYHISEIIELQQRFMGELGTENMTQLSGVIEASIKIFEETFNKRGVRIETDLASNVPEVLVDPSMMTQVYMNIIKNAVEAIDGENDKSKDYCLKVAFYHEEKEMDSEAEESFAVVNIADNGPGMSPDVKRHIFDFGFSTKMEKGASRGFGLHSCMDTIRKYGGTLLVDSEPGQGTSFKIMVPVSKKEA